MIEDAAASEATHPQEPAPEESIYSPDSPTYESPSSPAPVARIVAAEDEDHEDLIGDDDEGLYYDSD